MILLIIFLMLGIVVLGIGAMAAYSDFRAMKIPNRYSVIVALCFLPVLLIFILQGSPWLGLVLSHGLAGLVMFLLSFALFAFGFLGAGDSKIASAFALWLGLGALPIFLFVTTLVGALLGLSAILLRKYKPIKEPLPNSWIDQVQGGTSKVPYGIAIWVGALFGFHKAGYFDLSLYQSFLS